MVSNPLWNPIGLKQHAFPTHRVAGSIAFMGEREFIGARSLEKAADVRN
jgi:hypothetical protein